MVHEIKGKLLAAELLMRLKTIDVPAVDFDQAKSMASAAADAVQRGLFGYVLMRAASAHQDL